MYHIFCELSSHIRTRQTSVADLEVGSQILRTWMITMKQRHRNFAVPPSGTQTIQLGQNIRRATKITVVETDASTESHSTVGR